MLFYLPLEGYKERYTMQWSAPKTGWLERNWIKAGVEYTRIEPQIQPYRGEIKVGSVVDGIGRSMFCFDQIKELLLLAEQGKIKDSDVIYLDDFWTPGIEALPYAFHLLGIRPRVYAFLHAQSVDEFDFTHSMRHWMRHYEQGQGEWMDGIFVCGPCLRDLVVLGGIAPYNKVHITGHPFNSEEVMERMPKYYRDWMGGGYAVGAPHSRNNQVVWSSRWDSEKNPKFFLKVAENVIERDPTAKFIVCTSAPKLRSNDPSNITALSSMISRFPNNIELREGLTKEAYYAILCESKIQFNCANQDFVAITLLEASVAGCYPIYPYFRSFPETFLHRPGFMYQHLDVASAMYTILTVLRHTLLWGHTLLWDKDAIKSRSWIHERFDYSWLRMLDTMNIKPTAGSFIGTERFSDPYREDAYWAGRASFSVTV